MLQIITGNADEYQFVNWENMNDRANRHTRFAPRNGNAPVARLFAYKKKTKEGLRVASCNYLYRYEVDRSVLSSLFC